MAHKRLPFQINFTLKCSLFEMVVFYGPFAINVRFIYDIFHWWYSLLFDISCKLKFLLIFSSIFRKEKILDAFLLLEKLMVEHTNKLKEDNKTKGTDLKKIFF